MSDGQIVLKRRVRKATADLRVEEFDIGAVGIKTQIVAKVAVGEQEAGQGKGISGETNLVFGEN